MTFLPIVRKTFCSLLGTFVFTAGLQAHADDWLQFRGTAGDGISRIEELPQTWSDKEHVSWFGELPGEGWSSPVVVGDCIYLSAAIAGEAGSSERELALLIVDAKTGKLLNRSKLLTQASETPKIHNKNSHASPTPLVSGDRIYVHFGHLGTACTNLQGEVLWRNDKLAYPPVHGNGGSPVLVQGALIFSQDGAEQSKVIALSAETGELLWEVPRNVDATKKFSFCTPLVMDVGGKLQIVLPGSNVVQGLEPATGKELWRVRYEGYSVIPKPIIAGGLIMVCTGYDKPVLLAIKPGGSGDVTDANIVWQTKTSVSHTPSLVTRDGLLFMVSDNGIASCLEAATGKEVWKERIGGNFSASPLLAGDKIYLLSEEGDTTIIRASRKFEQLAKNSLGQRTLASMAVIDSDLLIRSKTGLWRITK